MKIEQDFINAMHDAGCAPATNFTPIADDKWHRYALLNDKSGVKTGTYRLKIQDGFGVGNFKSFRGGETHTFISKNNKKISKNDREILNARIAQEKSEFQRLEKMKNEKAAIKSKERLEKSTILFEHSYLSKKGVTIPEGLKSLRVDNGFILIPQYIDGKISGLQKIHENGTKRFQKNARLKGAYYPIMLDGDDLSTVYICEGLATGLTLREAVGEFPVIVAFNASNLVHVAEYVRGKYKNARIIICADNDQWSKDSKGQPYNAGTHYAQQAAVRVGGFMVKPEVSSDDELKRTDFNDIHVTDGIDAVREQVSTPEVESTMQEAGQPVHTPPATGEPPVSVYEDLSEHNGEILNGVKMPFRVLGYDEKGLFYYAFEMKQLHHYSAASHTINNLLMLATIGQWTAALGGEDGCKMSEIPTRALNILRVIAQKRGYFSQSDQTRGTGAWIDNGRTVLHCGDAIWVDGIETEMQNIKSKYVYVSAPRLMRPSKKPLTNAQAHKLYEICSMPTWENELSGALLAGWIVTAPVCSVLSWRPHIWLTGQSGSGKSTVLNDIVKPAVGDIAFKVDGKATEASLRERIGYSGRPVIFDEAEPSLTMNAVIDLARVASSGGTITKHNQNPFRAQFQACFSSINPPLKNYADKSRISLLVLKKNTASDSEAHYHRLLDEIYNTISDEWQQGLLARTLDNLDTLLINVQRFKSAARKVLNAGREAEQLAPMLAGLYLLHTTHVISEDDAIAWVGAKDWRLHTSISEISDPEKLLQHISTSLVRFERTGKDIMLGELIEKWCKAGAMDNSEKEDAFRALVRYGIKPDGEYIYIANNSQNLERLLSGTDWQYGWARNLGDLHDAHKTEKTVYFTPNNRQRAVRLPISRFVGSELEF